MSHPVSNAVSARSHAPGMALSPTFISGCLDREWAAIRARPRCIARARTWAVTDRPFADLDELLTLAGNRVPPTPATDEVLARLVTVARDDDLAARVVLQRILPGLLATAR